MAGQLAGKVVLVTGSSSGIGRAAALAVAAEGAQVVTAARRVSEGEATVEMIRAAGGESIFVQTDVTDAGQVQALVAAAVEAYGRLDCAFNNAGIEGEQAPLADYAEDEWEQVIRTNLTGVFLCMKYQIQQMLRQGGGVIVNCSSVSGLVGFRENSAYVASKHGVSGLTKAAALEYGHLGIRVNAVCPGVIRTEMVDRIYAAEPDAEAWVISRKPLARLGTPEDVAGAVVWLCSDAAAYVTGHNLTVDGGLIAQGSTSRRS
jgi:NAD(P)-dependent dehydrogenase (short-subunit alcohol dehydrogenase family)